ncbi:urea carboxylase [Acidomonas methanolica]|uniref:Urea amidolyase n=1 Tax=Acidomonas methanolica NBRC 104435 TaxID=1231351 RepID=A0A023D9T4_ACIMT|nr:urea carboxylase [Acidomonas methanolica]MBU2655573.1 urea carboxylase [Acidomonas methanolica]GAJ30581.1 urea amidolyase [Acidomonas methanolica NBRC 104435]GEL00359.1 urea carboxylase [Acidomonas methanolica NBRC 104435]
MFARVLVANRGAIACRIIRTLRELGVSPIAVYAEADAASLHVRQADIAVSLGEGGPTQTYLQASRIIEIAKETGAQAIHPGYGFLSENIAFAEACGVAGIRFIGPEPAHLRAFGLKHEARALAASLGMPLLDGSPLLHTIRAAQAAAVKSGYPVMLKSTAGGGGIGMRVCWNEAELIGIFHIIRRLGENNFSDSGVFIEKYVEHARHLEVQIFGDGQGNVISLGVRDCSVQRRNQKVIEETPAPGLPIGVADSLCEAAVRLGKAVRYRSAGTVEFVYDSATGDFYFLEVNTRLQVEHGVTEEVWGVDLVRWMVELEAGTLPPLNLLAETLAPSGHAIQARIYAEDPGKNFQPSPGLLTEVCFPPANRGRLRVDTWLEAGVEISPFFDPLVAKIIAHAPTRSEAINALDAALGETQLYGVETNRDYLRQIIFATPFASGAPWTRCLEELPYRASTIDVLAGGTQTTIQDFPGRLGYWAVGVPPSGPMDSRSFRLGNALVGNAPDVTGLEITMAGPTLRFNVDAVAVVTGADIPIDVDGSPRAKNTVFRIRAGETLRLGSTHGGARSMLCLRGGIDVPRYLGSRATFTLGKFGGHAGRPLRAGDVLHITPVADTSDERTLPPGLESDAAAVRILRVICGPHGAPEYFTPAYMDRFFAAEWEIHFNSNRTGIRLVGPRPEWVRDSGGEAGLHPSNIHDNPYAIGSVDFTGDIPVILGPDGPSLGGFVCPATVIEADLPQLGQLRAGDRIRFVPVTLETAREIALAQEREISTLSPVPLTWSSCTPQSPIVLDIGEGGHRLVGRLAGDVALLLEIGDATLDIALRFRVHALMQAIERAQPDGVIDLTPGIRSLQIHYAPQRLPLSDLLVYLTDLWRDVTRTRDIRVASRTVYLPLSWEDPACRLAIDKYMTTVRPNAPWCPDNIEFIRRINGLRSVEDVRNIVYGARYLVMGLGDVYLGAPVATPLDPRQRLVTTKYNPARTWTAENSVGIGGAYLCVYGMEGPGGYQFVGRTVQMWARYTLPGAFDGKPWLLRFFDQIRFFPVSAMELEKIRRDFPIGRYTLRIEQGELSLSEYEEFLTREAAEITSFRSMQMNAFEEERRYWIEAGLDCFESSDAPGDTGDEGPLAEGEVAVESNIAGNVWQVLVSPGERVTAGQAVVILESMKIEIALSSPVNGVVHTVRVAPGKPVRAGQPVVVLAQTRES